MQKLFSIILFVLIVFNLHSQNDNKYTIVIHAGAGTISKDLPEDVKQSYFDALSEVLQYGKDLLENGDPSLDVVEKVIVKLENNPKFNAGKGAVFNMEGMHELDASIMDGRDLSSGAVTIVTNVKNPIKLARLVMEETPHVLLAGVGAEEFAKEMNLEIVDNSYFDTEKRREQYERMKERWEVKKHGTVGCVVLDNYGNIAAGTSTGGTSNKMKGRIGDSPLINAGTYADNNTCGVSATGTGELFIKNTVAYNISALMKYKGLTLKEAGDEMIYETLDPGDGGIIAVDKNGNYTMPFNSTGMFRGVATSEGKFEVKIWE